MNEIKIFENSEFGQLKTLNINGEPWFIGKDVAEILGYTNPQKAIRIHVKDKDKGVNEMDTPGGVQQTIIINEAGLYRLVFSSKLEKAEEFTDWVTHEVLPSIRKTGGYISGQETLDEDQLVERALEVVSRRLAERERQLNSVVEQNKVLTEDNNKKARQINKLMPKATYYDKVLSCKDPIRTRVLAKDYGWSAQKLNQWLADHDIQYNQNGTWLLKQRYANKGYTIQQTYTYQDYNGNYHSQIHTSWTQSGRLFVYDKLKKHGILPNIEKHNEENFDWDDIDDDLYELEEE